MVACGSIDQIAVYNRAMMMFNKQIDVSTLKKLFRDLSTKEFPNPNIRELNILLL